MAPPTFPTGPASPATGHAPPAFEFRKAAMLVEVTDYRASSLAHLLTGVTLVPPESLFFHLHQRLFREPDRLAPYPNDFAEWSDATLGDAVVAERLANVNLFRSGGLGPVRRELSLILAQHIEGRGDGRTAPTNRAFVFCRPRFVVLAVGGAVRTPQQFLEVLGSVESDTIGFHLFVSKVLRHPGPNDFAKWFRAWGFDGLARQLDALDPYLNSLEDNRQYLVELIESALRSGPESGRA